MKVRVVRRLDGAREVWEGDRLLGRLVWRDRFPFRGWYVHVHGHRGPSQNGGVKLADAVQVLRRAASIEDRAP